jgi:hypothetical protein
VQDFRSQNVMPKERSVGSSVGLCRLCSAH